MNVNEINFEEKLKDGSPRYRRFEGGMVRDYLANKIVSNTLAPGRASELAHSRWDRWRKANASAVLREAQAINPDIKTEEDAFAMLVGKTFTAIMDSDKPRGDDLMKVGQLIGAAPTIADIRQDSEKRAPSQLETALAGMIRELARRGDIVDGQVVPPELEEPE